MQNLLLDRKRGTSFNRKSRQPYMKPAGQMSTSIRIGDKLAFSAAQAMTLIGYGDNENGVPVRSLDYKVKCEDYADLATCINIIDNYNEFDASLIQQKAFFKLNLQHFLNEDNPNNGKSLFDFWIAREGSPAFYVGYNSHFNRMIITDTEDVPATETEEAKTILFWEEYTADDFKANMKWLAGQIHADEFSIEEVNYNFGSNPITHYTARFWFD